MSLSFIQLQVCRAARSAAMLGVGAALLLATGWLALAAEPMPYGKGLLWKIERAGVAPSRATSLVPSIRPTSGSAGCSSRLTRRFERPRA